MRRLVLVRVQSANLLVDFPDSALALVDERSRAWLSELVQHVQLQLQGD